MALLTITGNPAAFSTCQHYDDGALNTASNRAIPLQALANQCSYLKAQAPVLSAYVGSAAAYDTLIETIAGDSAWHPSTVLTYTFTDVPAGAVIIADAMVFASCAGAGNGVRLEILEGSTITPDAYGVLPVPVTGVHTLVYLHGRFVKTGLGSVTVRVGGKGSAGPTMPIYAPSSLRVQVQKQF